MKWRDLNKQQEIGIDALRGKPAHIVLGVEIDATPAIVRKAYLKLAKAYHPDRSDPFMRSYNQEVLKIVTLAYAQLTETRK
jgi:DnaJ-class molecular chaperone